MIYHLACDYLLECQVEVPYGLLRMVGMEPLETDINKGGRLEPFMVFTTQNLKFNLFLPRAHSSCLSVFCAIVTVG